jgi:YbbR domain-containing protein
VVELSGPPGRLDSLRGTVYTEPVDLGEAEGTVERRVRLDLPDGVTAVGAPEGVTVTIRVAPLPGTRTFDVELSPDGLSSTLEVASITPARVQVLLSGPLPILDAMKASDIRALLPLDGVVEGTHRLPPTYDVPPGVRVRTSTPAEVEVVLRPRAGPPGG